MKVLGKSLLELKALIDEKKIKTEEIFHYFLQRIKKYDPKLKAFMTVVDRDRSGLPIAVKDNYCTKGVRTTASSKVLDDYLPQYESTVTEKLWKNGFSLLGKTNMDAWAHGASTETSDYMLTKNPWDLTRYPGGSSGGSAAALSAYLTPAAMGSDTGGSIRHPAAWCGVVGLKPTYGRVSRYGLISMGSSFDCPGPMTLTVKDNAHLLGLLAGKDRFDATTTNVAIPDYVKNLDPPQRFTIGLAESYFENVDNEIKSRLNQTITVLKKLGHQIKPVKILSPKYAISVYTVLQRSEVSSNLSRYDGVRYANDRHFFGAEAKRRTMLGTYSLSYGYYDAFYKRAQKVRTLVIKNFLDLFRDVDLIIGPNTPLTALKIGEFEKYPFFGEIMDALNEPASVAGIPAISLPIGLDRQGLPVGMQIMGNYFREDLILNLAHQFEQETEFFGVIKRGVKNYPD